MLGCYTMSCTHQRAASDITCAIGTLALAGRKYRSECFCKIKL